METIEAYLAYDKPKVGWCLLCNSPIESSDDFIPGTPRTIALKDSASTITPEATARSALIERLSIMLK